MVRIIVMMCGIALIAIGSFLAYRVIQLATTESELIIERIVAVVVALIAVSTGVFLIASV